MRYFYTILLSFLSFIAFSQEVQDASTSDETENQEASTEDEETTEAEEKTKFKEWPEILFSIGASFDFLDGVSANDLYYDLNADFPTIFKKNKDDERSFKNNWGLEFGIYQTRTISYQDTLTKDLRIVNAFRPTPEDDFIFSYITVETEKTTIINRENLGIFLQPKYNLLLVEEGVDRTAYLNAIGHIEWVRSTINTIHSQRYISFDTASAVPDTWPRPYNNIRRLPPEEVEFKVNESYLNYAGGFDLFISRASGAMHLKGIYGESKINTHQIVDEQETFNESTIPFYLLQAEILENKFLGIKLGAEVRGFFPKRAEEVNQSSDKTSPFLTIYLAKQFSLERIGQFISGIN